MSRASLPIFFSTVMMATPSFAKERSKVPEKLKWDTSALYASDADWHKKAAELAKKVPDISALQGKLGGSPDGFFRALDSVMQVDQELSRLGTYANMRSDEDTREAKPREMKQMAEDLGVKFATAIAFLRPEILALGKTKVMGFVAADKRLSSYQVWLEDILRWAPHTLSAAEEKIAAQAQIMADGGGSVHSIFTNADLPYPEITLAKGEKVRLDASAYTKYRAVHDRATRDKVFTAFWTRYKEFERTLGTTLDAHVKAQRFEKDVHKFDSCLDAALFSTNVPTTVYKQLIKDVHSNLPTLHRYLRLRQRMMGVDQLRYEDLYAPIVKKVDLQYTPEQAEQMVLDACTPLGPQYLADLKKGFDDRWVDWIPTTGKRSGAYSTGVFGVHPYQLQNFTGTYDEVSTVAHESGHSMHTFLSDKNQPYVTHDYKIFVAEVASTLNENLLLHSMLGKTKDTDTRLFLLGNHLDGMRTTLFRQTLLAEFELRIHEIAEQGEPLTGEKLTDIYLALLKEYYGDAAGVCKVKDLYGVEWAYIPHFYYNFYVYQYATSIVASSKIAAGMRVESQSKEPSTVNRDAYLRMLSAGSSKYPMDLLKDAGVDMTTSEPFAAAMKEMNDIMDEIEKILTQRNKK